MIGTAAEKMKKAWGDIKPVQTAATMEEAVQVASGFAENNEVVLLSPGCTSFDMFISYEERGTVFKKYVKELKNSSGK